MYVEQWRRPSVRCELEKGSESGPCGAASGTGWWPEYNQLLLNPTWPVAYNLILIQHMMFYTRWVGCQTLACSEKGFPTVSADRNDPVNGLSLASGQWSLRSSLEKTLWVFNVNIALKIYRLNFCFENCRIDIILAITTYVVDEHW